MTFVRSLLGGVGRIKVAARHSAVAFTEPQAAHSLLPIQACRRWQTTSSVDYDNADPADVVSLSLSFLHKVCIPFG
jgi:hypothetical protein